MYQCSRTVAHVTKWSWEISIAEKTRTSLLLKKGQRIAGIELESSSCIPFLLGQGWRSRGIRFLYFLCAVRTKLPAIYRTFRRLLPRLAAVSGPRARRHGKFNLEPEITSPLWCGLSIRKLRLPEAEQSLPREIVQREIGSTRRGQVFPEVQRISASPSWSFLIIVIRNCIIVI